MEFITGFAVWLAIGLIGGFLARTVYKETENTVTALAIVFGVFGAFIGGMLGTAPYIFHDPLPLRLGGLIGASSGAFIFPFIYQYMGRRFV